MDRHRVPSRSASSGAVGVWRVFVELSVSALVVVALGVSALTFDVDGQGTGFDAPDGGKPVPVPAPVAQDVVEEIDMWAYPVAVGVVDEVVVHRERPVEVSGAGEIGEVAALGMEPDRHDLAAFVSAIPTPGRNVAGRIGEPWGWRFTNPAPDGHAATFPVVSDHGPWLHVRVPVRPNGSLGWVRAESVRVEQRRSKAVVDLSERRLSIIDGGIETWSTPVAVGGSGTPTPTGRFHVTGPVGTGDPRGPYGPWVIGLSGFSEALDSFDGGAPGLAVHGTNRPERIGQAVSNGCIRVPNESLDVLLVHLVPGTVVDVHE